MSLKRNKRDFEWALTELESLYEAKLRDVLDINACEIILNVINEYNSHYQSGIEELSSENEELQEKLDSLD